LAYYATTLGHFVRIRALAYSALATGLIIPCAAHAQNSTPAPTTQTAQNEGLQEIVVTAQKREQLLQDVPIAITAITSQALQANRVMSVDDLTGLAPNVTVRASAGGSQIPAFTARGVTSYGVVPGSDKEFSIYLDGVYLGSSHSLFDLPDIARIEVLRGPQGTLFGRNSTAGAVSIITRDPTGRLGLTQDLTMGNLDEFRSRTTLDLPAWGAFSAYVSFVHDEHRGDVRNLGGGTFWDRTGPDTRMGAQYSPEWLGGKNENQVFAALKFEPSSDFSTVYKFDFQVNHFTPEAEAPVAYNPAGVTTTFTPALGPMAPFYAAYFNAIVAANNPVFDPSGKRPNAVNNSWTVPGFQKVYGHNLTSNLRLGDSLSLKNVAAYRYSFVTSASQLDGLGGETVPQSAVQPYAAFVGSLSVPGFLSYPAATQQYIASQIAQNPQVQAAAGVGGRFILTDTNAQSQTKQWSDELQANYRSDLLDLTVGGLWFHETDITGGPVGIMNTPAFADFPANGRVPLATSASTPSGQSNSYNKSTSIAAYGQAEIHATRQIEIVLGGRVTHDNKSGQYVFGGTYVPPSGAKPTSPNYYTGGTITGLTSEGFTYSATKFTYSAGVNYKPIRDVLVYGKYSTGFVSGGSIGGLGWQPETVASVEAGIKAELLDRRLITNLALYHAKYKNVQSAQGGTNLGRPELGTAIADLGDERAQGAELEVTALPVRNLTLGGNLGFTDAKYTRLTPLIQTIYGTGYQPTLLPKWTSNVYAQFRSDPFWGDTRLTARIDGDWRSQVRFLSGSNVLAVAAFQPLVNGPARWIVNSRIGFENLGPAHLGISLWSRNLTNNKDAQFPLGFATYELSASFQQARTYGVDMSVKF
jgi:iron complex outermembrane receptor protein